MKWFELTKVIATVSKVLHQFFSFITLMWNIFLHSVSKYHGDVSQPI